MPRTNGHAGPVLITGGAGNLGRLLVERLIGKCSVVAADVQAPRRPLPPGAEFRELDVRSQGAVESLVREVSPASIAHLAFVLVPQFDGILQRQINVDGSLHVIAAARAAKVRKIVLASSTTVYGAHPDNPEYLTEDSPLRPNPGVRYAAEKIEVESALKKWSGSIPGAVATALRPCTIIGPSFRNVLVDAIRRSGQLGIRILPYLGSSGPNYQFVHESDVARSFAEAILEDHPGAWNVAGAGVINRTAAKRLGFTPLAFPAAPARFAAKALWRSRLANSDPAVLPLLEHGWAVSSAKIEHEWGFKFHYTSETALASAL